MPRWVSSSLTDEEKKQLAQGTQQPAPLHPRSEDSALVPQASGQLEADPQTAAPKKRWVSANLDLGDFRGSKLQQFLPLISGQKNALDLGVHLDGGRIYRSLQLFADKTPKQAGRAQKIVDMAAGRVPFDVVIRNQQEWEKWAEERKAINELLEKDADGRYKHPITAGWLLDPKKMALAKDDLKAVTALEHAAREHHQRGESALTTIDRSLGYSAMGIYKTMAQTPGFFIGLVNYLPDKLLQTLGVDFRFGVPDYLFDNALTRYLEEQEEKFRPIEVEKSPVELLLQGKHEEAAESLAVHTLVNIPQLLMLVAGHAAFGAKAFYGGAGTLGGTPAMDAALDEGLDSVTATERAILHGMAEGIFEIPTLGLIKGFGKPLVYAAGKPGAVKVIRNMALRILGAGTVEGASEAATSAAQDFADVLTGDKDAMDGATIRLLDAALVGFTLGGGIGTVSGVAGLPGQMTRNAQQKQMLTELEATAEQSKLRERAPEQFEEVVDTVIKGHGLESTFTVSLDTLRTFYQKDPDQLNEFIEKLGLQDQIEDAGKFGTELKVALGKWVTHASELNLPPEFADHLRFDEGGLTVEEMKAEAERYTETLAEVSEAAQAQALPARATAIREQLVRPKKKGGLGLKAADADANIAVLMAGARVLSQHQGESAEQWFDRVNPVLKIGAAAPEAGVRGAVQFDDTQTTIHLFETADRSTFMHETAHIFTRQMNTMVEAGVGDAQLQKDLDTLKKFAGQLDTAGHEKIARAFETYLFEGKAPTFRLRDAFRRFRRWLTGIYTAIGGGPHVAINDEVRGVFDRMLAAEADIHMAQVYYGFHGTRKALMDYVKPTKREKAALDKKREKATETAIDRQIRKYVGAFVKAWGGRAQLRAQAQKEIESLPVYVALRDAVDSGGLNTADIRAEYGQETVKQLKSKNRRLAVKNGQTTLAQLAIKHNFESPDALLDALIAAPAIRPAVTARTNQLVAQAEADIRADLERHERIAGEEAVHNDDSLAYLIAEANLASKKLMSEGRKKLKKLEKAAVKDAAEAHIGKKLVREVISFRPLGKPQKKADAAARKGDWAKVRKHQEDQVNQKALMEAANRARKEIQKIEARYKVTEVRGRLKSVENSYANAIIQILVGHGLTQSKTLKMPKGDPLGELLKQDTNLARLIPGKLSNPPSGGWKDLTMDELRALDASVKTLLTDGSIELKSLEDSRYRTSQDVAEASMEAMDGLKDREIHDEFSKKEHFLRIYEGLRASWSMMQYPFDRLDGGQFRTTKTFGPLRTMLNRVRTATSQQVVMEEQTLENAEPHMKVLLAAVQRLHAERGKRGFYIDGVPVPDSMKKLGRRWTGDRVISVVLNMGNAGNLAVLENSFKYTPAQLDKIASLLTKQELEAIQGIWDVTNSLYPALDKVHFNLYNRHVEKVQAQPLKVTTRDGEVITLEGGYYPLVFDPLLSNRAGKYAEEDLLKNERTAVFRAVKPDDGFVHSREKNVSQPPLLSLSVWFKHVDTVTKYISHAEVLRDLNRVTMNPQWAEKVIEKSDRAFYGAVRDWVKSLAHKREYGGDAWERLLDWNRKMATIAILGLNLRVGVKQRLSMFNAMGYIGKKGFRAVMGAGLGISEGMDLKTSAFGSTSTDSWQNIIRLSPFIRAREKNIDREIADTVSKINPLVKRFKIRGIDREFTWRDVMNFTFFWIKMNDRGAVAAVWTGAFNVRLDELADDTSLTEAQKQKIAVEYADTVVQDTQPSSLQMDLNRLQRSGSGTGQGAMRLFTAFMTWTFKFGNIMHSEFRHFRDGTITLREYSRSMLFQFVLPTLGSLWLRPMIAMSVLGTYALFGGDVDWDEVELPSLTDYPAALIGALLSPIPGLRDLEFPARTGRELGPLPAMEGLKRTARTWHSGYDLVADDGEWSKFLWDFGRLMEFLFGIPASNVVREIQRTLDDVEDAIE